MNTHEARVDTTLNALRADQNALRTDQNALRTDIERGQNAQTKWIVGAVVAAVIILIGVLG